MILRYRAWYVLAEEMIDEILMISFLRKEIIGKFSNGYISVPLKFEDKRNGEDVILMQSTGLKDKNRVEIFEGDVVKCNGLLGIIESFKAMWICSFMKYNNYQKVGFSAQEIEVVDSIYENPELLEDLKRTQK